MAEREPEFESYGSELGNLKPATSAEKAADLDVEYIPNLEFEPVDEDDLVEVETWLDEESIPEPAEETLLRQAPKTLKPHKKPDQTKQMAIKVNNRPVAFFQLKKFGGVGRVFMALAPHVRGLGLGKPLLAKLERAADVEVNDFRVWVHINNLAGQKVLRATGYQPVRRKGNFIEFRKRTVEPHITYL